MTAGDCYRLALDWAALARRNGNEREARALEGFAKAIGARVDEETTDPQRVLICPLCGATQS